jgi:hypothetical protein
MMNASEIQEAVKKVLGEDPIEVCVNYYKGLIQLSADRIAEENKNIHKLEERIKDLTEKGI